MSNVLKCEKKTVFYVEYSDLETFINTHYGVTGYEMPSCEECGPDEVQKYEILAPKEPNRWDEADIAEFIANNGNKSFITRQLLADLIRKGALEPGTYMVNVSW